MRWRGRPATIALAMLATTVLEGADRMTGSVVRAQTRDGTAAPIPHGQDLAPNAPRSPAEAALAMTVPPGFQVEVVAAEPDIVNPVAMTFDERGRIWLTESLEYPRREPGPGRDRVKVLEDTNGDGKADRFTIFAQGLNIPSGIAVGHGGVWVANSPDILFLEDRDGDGKADSKEVVATGFGRSDTHELPNSLTWGPDGWLYGWNGVFNPGKVVSRNGKTYQFTCAIFRIHPRTRVFEVWCEGTSNPWGIAIDPEGSFFASACVIDHLWHLVETGYYHRQGGPYPPFTWPIGSIVDHAHQKAAYCGIHYFDSPAYPAEYRGRLYMGNIHGNCVNVDVLEKNGSTYRAKPAPDFLRANDSWFMPVAQQTGPDGCLYILDWYDRYHCYQDANRDPAGIDRLKGRLYRVRYKDTPRRVGFDIARSSDDELIEFLASPNVYDRDVGQRLLTERASLAIRGKLEALVLNETVPRTARMNGLWALIGAGVLEPDFHIKLLNHKDPGFRAWGVRAAGNIGKVETEIRDLVTRLARDPSPDVRLQVAIAARKIERVDPIPVLLEVLSAGKSDPLIPQIVWQNLHPLLEVHGDDFAALITPKALKDSPALVRLMPRVIDRLLGRGNSTMSPIVAIMRTLIAPPSEHAVGPAREAIEILAEQVQSGAISAERLNTLRSGLESPLRRIFLDLDQHPLRWDAVLLAASWKDPKAREGARNGCTSSDVPERLRLGLLDDLIAARDADVWKALATIFKNREHESVEFRGRVLAALGKLDDPRVSEFVLGQYRNMEPDLQPRAIALLTERPQWTKAFLAAVASKQIPATVLNVTQLRKLQHSRDPEIANLVKTIWGTVRDRRNPQRERVADQIRNLLHTTPGDPVAGQAVFKKLCAQCHKIYGEGQDVGPEITANGRNDFEQLLSNIFDPSLVIGPGYQATTLATTLGRVLTGLLVEDGKDRVVLKLQGGTLETIPRSQIDEMKTSPISLMPEEIEKQLAPQEIADLCAFLCLDKPPSDPAAKPLPGAGPMVRRPK
ncbi:MAG: PVC-type heme-binding CxxCH protein [Isosphaerales bacterium]